MSDIDKTIDAEKKEVVGKLEKLYQLIKEIYKEVLQKRKEARQRREEIKASQMNNIAQTGPQEQASHQNNADDNQNDRQTTQNNKTEAQRNPQNTLSRLPYCPTRPFDPPIFQPQISHVNAMGELARSEKVNFKQLQQTNGQQTAEQTPRLTPRLTLGQG